MEAIAPQTTIPVGELVKLCALDNDLFDRTFFPKTVRQRTPEFHRLLLQPLEDPNVRLVNLRCFRGSAKTSRLRIFTAKRIAYKMSRTILYIGASEGHALRSIQWLRANIEPKGDRRPLYSQVYDLRPGRKWQETEIEIVHGTDEDHPIWVLGVGITGNIRGINFDDYRPDLIILDDPLTDENCATHEQREKITDLILGAVKNSLASPVDEPNAKLALAQTPIHRDDAGAQAERDPQWTTATFGCWTPETMGLPIEEQRSIWPEQFPDAMLQADKKAAIARNRLSIFAREMECQLITAESCSFRPEWLQYFTENPQCTTVVLSIDPVPPPSEIQLAKNLKKKDFEVIHVWGLSKGNYYLLERISMRGHDPSWTLAKTFELAQRWRTTKWIVETVNYQRTLKFLLEQEMARRQVYYQVVSFNSRTAKYQRIIDTLNGPGSQRRIFCRNTDGQFIEQWCAYGPGHADHDDELDAASMALRELTRPIHEMVDEKGNVDNTNVVPLQFRRRAP